MAQPTGEGGTGVLLNVPKITAEVSEAVKNIAVLKSTLESLSAAVGSIDTAGLAAKSKAINNITSAVANMFTIMKKLNGVTAQLDISRLTLLTTNMNAVIKVFDSVSTATAGGIRSVTEALSKYSGNMAQYLGGIKEFSDMMRVLNEIMSRFNLSAITNQEGQLVEMTIKTRESFGALAKAGENVAGPAVDSLGKIQKEAVETKLEIAGLATAFENVGTKTSATATALGNQFKNMEKIFVNFKNAGAMQGIGVIPVNANQAVLLQQNISAIKSMGSAARTAIAELKRISESDDAIKEYAESVGKTETEVRVGIKNIVGGYEELRRKIADVYLDNDSKLKTWQSSLGQVGNMAIKTASEIVKGNIKGVDSLSVYILKIREAIELAKSEKRFTSDPAQKEDYDRQIGVLKNVLIIVKEIDSARKEAISVEAALNAKLLDNKTLLEGTRNLVDATPKERTDLIKTIQMVGEARAKFGDLKSRLTAIIEVRPELAGLTEVIELQNKIENGLADINKLGVTRLEQLRVEASLLNKESKGGPLARANKVIADAKQFAASAKVQADTAIQEYNRLAALGPGDKGFDPHAMTAETDRLKMATKYRLNLNRAIDISIAGIDALIATQDRESASGQVEIEVLEKIKKELISQGSALNSNTASLSTIEDKYVKLTTIMNNYMNTILKAKKIIQMSSDEYIFTSESLDKLAMSFSELLTLQSTGKIKFGLTEDLLKSVDVMERAKKSLSGIKSMIDFLRGEKIRYQIMQDEGTLKPDAANKYKAAIDVRLVQLERMLDDHRQIVSNIELQISNTKLLKEIDDEHLRALETISRLKQGPPASLLPGGAPPRGVGGNVGFNLDTAKSNNIMLNEVASLTKLTGARLVDAEAAQKNAVTAANFASNLSKEDLAIRENVEVLNSAGKALTRSLLEMRLLREELIMTANKYPQFSAKLREQAAALDTMIGKSQPMAAGINLQSEATTKYRRSIMSLSDEIRSVVWMQLKYATTFALLYGAAAKVREVFKAVAEEQENVAHAMTASKSAMLDFANRAVVIDNMMNKLRVGYGSTFKETGDIMYQLGSSGLSVEESLAAAGNAMDLVVGTGVEADKVTKMLASSFNILKERGETTSDVFRDFAHISDVIGVVFRDNQIEVDEFVEALKYVLPVSKQVGVSFEEASALIGTMAQLGIKAGLAGRNLRQTFFEMATDRKKFEKAFADVGLKIDPNKPLDFMDIIKQATKEVEKGALSAQKLGEVLKATGTRGGAGLLILMEAGELLNKNMTAVGDNVSGVTSEMAKMKLDAINKQLDIFDQNMMSIGMTMLNLVIPAFSWIVSGINSIAVGFAGLPGWYKDLVGGLVSVIGLFGALALAVGVAVTVWMTFHALISLATGSWKQSLVDTAVATANAIKATSVDTAAKVLDAEATAVLARAETNLATSRLAAAAATGVETSATEASLVAKKSAWAWATGMWSKIPGPAWIKIVGVILASIAAIGVSVWLLAGKSIAKSTEELQAASMAMKDALGTGNTAIEEASKRAESFTNKLEKIKALKIKLSLGLSADDVKKANSELQNTLKGLGKDYVNVVQQNPITAQYELITASVDGMRASLDAAKESAKEFAEFQKKTAYDTNIKTVVDNSKDYLKSKKELEDQKKLVEELNKEKTQLHSPMVGRLMGMSGFDALGAERSSGMDTIEANRAKRVIKLYNEAIIKQNEFESDFMGFKKTLTDAGFSALSFSDKWLGSVDKEVKALFISTKKFHDEAVSIGKLDLRFKMLDINKDYNLYGTEFANKFVEAFSQIQPVIDDILVRSDDSFEKSMLKFSNGIAALSSVSASAQMEFYGALDDVTKQSIDQIDANFNNLIAEISGQSIDIFNMDATTDDLMQDNGLLDDLRQKYEDIQRLREMKAKGEISSFDVLSGENDIITDINRLMQEYNDKMGTNYELVSFIDVAWGNTSQKMSFVDDEIVKMISNQAQLLAITESYNSALQRSKVHYYGAKTLAEQARDAALKELNDRGYLGLDKEQIDAEFSPLIKALKDSFEQAQSDLKAGIEDKSTAPDKLNDLQTREDFADKALKAKEDEFKLVTALNQKYAESLDQLRDINLAHKHILAETNEEQIKITKVGRTSIDALRYEISLYGAKNQRLIENGQVEDFYLRNRLKMTEEQAKLYNELLQKQIDLKLAGIEERKEKEASFSALFDVLEGERSIWGVSKDILILGNEFNDTLVRQEELSKELVGLDVNSKNYKERTKHIQGELNKLNVDYVNETAKLLQYLKEGVKLIDQMRDIMKDFLGLQRQAIQGQSEILSGQMDRTVENLKKVLSVSAEQNPFDFMIKSLGVLGNDVNIMGLSTSEVIDVIANAAQRGTANIGALSNAFGGAAGSMARFVQEKQAGVNALKAEELDLIKTLASIETKRIETLLSKPGGPTVEELQAISASTSTLLGYAKDIQSVDENVAFGIYAKLKEFARLMATLAENRTNDLVINFNIDVPRVIEQLNKIQAAFEAMIANMEAAGEEIPLKLRIDNQTMVDLGAAAWKAIESNMSKLKAGLAPPGFATGGTVPGYGSGDTVPAMLTPGEFVLPKNIVSQLGSDMLYKIISGYPLTSSEIANVTSVLSNRGTSERSAIKGLRRGDMSLFGYINQLEDVDYDAYKGIREYVSKYGIHFAKGGLVGGGVQGFAVGGPVNDEYNYSPSARYARSVQSPHLTAYLSVDRTNIKEFVKELQEIMGIMPIVVPVTPEIVGKNEINEINKKMKEVNPLDNEDAKDSMSKYMQLLMFNWDKGVKIMRGNWRTQLGNMMEDSKPILERFAGLLINAVTQAFSNSASAILDAVSGVFTAVFDISWIQFDKNAVDQTKKTMDDIAKTYDDGLRDLIKSLRRNEISYYEYLNRLEDLNDKYYDDLAKAQEDALVKGNENDIYGQRIDAIIQAIHDGFMGVIGSFYSPFSDMLKNAFATAATNSMGDLVGAYVGSVGFGGGEVGNLINKWSWMNDKFSSPISGSLTAAQNMAEGPVQPSAVGLNDDTFNKWRDSKSNEIDLMTKFGSILGISEENTKKYGDAIKTAGSVLSDFAGVAMGAIGLFVSIGSVLATLDFAKVETFLFGGNVNGEKVGGIVDQIGSVVDRMIKDAPKIVEAIVRKLPDVVNALVEAIPKIAKTISPLVNKMMEAILKELPKLFTALTEGIQVIAKDMPKFMDLLGKMIVELVNGLGDILAKGIVPIIATVIVGILKSIPSVIESLISNLGKVMGSISKILAPIVVGVLQAIMKLGPAISRGVSNFISELVRSAPDVIGSIIDQVPELIASIISSLPLALDELANELANIFRDVFNKELWSGFFTQIGKLFTTAFWSEVGSKIADAFKDFGGGFARIWNGIKWLGEKIWEGLKWAGNHIGIILLAVPYAIWEAIKWLFGSLPTLLSEAVGWLMEKIYDGLVWVIENFAKILLPLIWLLEGIMIAIDWVVGFFSRVFSKSFWTDTIWSAIEKLPQAIADAIGNGLSKAGNWFSDAVGWVYEKVLGGKDEGWTKAGRTVLSGGQNLLTDIYEGIKSIVPWHTGGIVGNSFVADNTGKLKYNEEAARLLKGEGVLNLEAMRMLGRDRFEQLNAGVPIEQVSASEKMKSDNISKYSYGVPISSSEGKTYVNNSGGNSVDESNNLHFHYSNCTFSSDNLVEEVEDKIAKNYRNRRGNLQKVIKNDFDNTNLKR